MSYNPIENVFVIGLGHKCRHGKDTAAAHIVHSTKGQAVVHSFSDDLYAIARIIFGMTVKDAGVLQWLGTEGFRKKNPNTWTDSMYWKLQYKRPRIAVIPDCRFPNEVDFVRQMGGTLIKVSRQNADGSPFVSTDRDPNHPSETALDGYRGWDYHIQVPSGQLNYLRDEVDNILWELRDKIGVDF
jgi:hypothetical protein